MAEQLRRVTQSHRAVVLHDDRLSNGGVASSDSAPSSSSAFTVLPAPTTAYLQYHLTANALHSSRLLRSRAALMQIDVKTGHVEFNQRWAHLNGWKEDAVSRRFVAPFHTMRLTPRPMIRDSHTTGREPSADDEDEETEDCTWIPANVAIQYPRSVSVMQDLFEGRLLSARVPWRTFFSSVQFSEFEGNVFAQETEWREGEDGQRRELPIKLISVVTECRRITAA